MRGRLLPKWPSMAAKWLVVAGPVRPIACTPPPSLPVPGLLLLPLLLQDEVVELIHNREWKAARQRGDVLMAFIADASGSHTLEDVRR